MAIALKLSNELVEDAKSHAAAEHRSVPKQIEYWARHRKGCFGEPRNAIALNSGHDTVARRGEGGAGHHVPVWLIKWP